MQKKKKKKNVEHFPRKSSLAHFPPARELSVHLMLLTLFSFKLKFLVEKLMELR